MPMKLEGSGDEGARRVGLRAHALMATGSCCAEAVVAAVGEAALPQVPEGIAAACRALCGGMGNRDATCGVFTGAAVVIGLALPGVSKKELKGVTARFQERLRREAGALACRDLLAIMAPDNGDYGQCRRLTQRGAELALEAIRNEKGR